jgi:hypothetical protein
MKRDGEVSDIQFFARLFELTSFSELRVGREETGAAITTGQPLRRSDDASGRIGNRAPAPAATEEMAR